MSQRNLENVKEVLFQYGRVGMRLWCDLCGWMTLIDVTDDEIFCAIADKEADPKTAYLTFNKEGCLKLKVGNIEISDLLGSDCVIHPNPSKAKWDVLTWRKGTVVRRTDEYDYRYFIVDKVNNDDYNTFTPMVEVFADRYSEIQSIEQCPKTSDGKKCKISVNSYSKLNEEDTREFYRKIEKFTGRLFSSRKGYKLLPEFKTGQYVELTYAKPGRGLVSYAAIFNCYDVENRTIHLHSMVKKNKDIGGLEYSMTFIGFNDGIYFGPCIYLDHLYQGGVSLSIIPADLATEIIIDNALHAAGLIWCSTMRKFDIYEKPASSAVKEQQDSQEVSDNPSGSSRVTTP